MVVLDKDIVNATIVDKSNKDILCHENKEILQQLSYNSNAVFNHMALNFSAYESAQIIKSNDVFIKVKSKVKSKTNYNNRQIVMVDLGLNFNNLSYRHPCIIMQVVKDKLFVVPCKSGSAPRYKDKDEAVDKIRDGYLEGDENDGFDHLTTILLKEAACIDKSQVIYSLSVEMENSLNGKEKNKNKNKKLCKITPEKYAEINNELHKLLFSWQNLQIKKLEHDLSSLKAELEKSNKENKTLREENEKLQVENLSFKETALE